MVDSVDKEKLTYVSGLPPAGGRSGGEASTLNHNQTN